MTVKILTCTVRDHRMLPTDKFFVPREEIVKLTAGSFEHRTVRVEAALKLAKAKFENTDVQLLGTFDGYAIVLGENGKVYRAAFESSATGDVQLREVGVMDGAKVYAREAMPAFLRKEARIAADLFLKGLVKQANEKVAQISKMVEANTVYSDDQIVDAFLTTISSLRPWRHALGLKTEAELKTTLGEAFEKIDSNKLQPKFSKLYDGSLSGEELEQYRTLVQEDFGKLMERVSAVYDQTLKTVGQLRTVSEKVSEAQRETVAAFVSFVEDLLADLSQTKQALAETLQGADGVGALGRLFDHLTEEMLRFEIAGSFVVRMTTQLAEASR